MKIDVARLSEDREIELFEEWDPKIFDLDAPGISYVGPLAVRAYARKESGVVGVRVVLKAKTTLTCARCFKQLQKDISGGWQYPRRIDIDLSAEDLV